MDYVFITKFYKSQLNISKILKSNIPQSLLLTEYCREQVYKIICNYYLIPCGNKSSKHPPISICPEECSIVEQACPSAWKSLTLGLRDYGFINCNDTSSNLLPLPNCCTGVGVQEPLTITITERGFEKISVYFMYVL